MDHQRQALKIGAIARACSIFLRLFGFAFSAARDIFQETEWLSLAVFLQTGRVVRFPRPEKPTIAEPEVTIPAPTQPPPVVRPVFSQEDLAQVGVINDSGYSPGYQALLEAPLAWDLSDGQPAVLIVQTHATEA